jgi:hypothetical protein
MKSYPSLRHAKQGYLGEPCFAFEKFDGSNIRYEWNKKRGWYKFGTRKCMLDTGHKYLGTAIPIFLEKYGEDLAKVFTDTKDFRGIKTFTVFCEFFGPKSFAGLHQPEDKMDTVLFDVNPLQKNFLSPKDFLKHFGHLHIPDVVYEGNYNKQLIEDVRTGKYDVDEGVVCKGKYFTKVWMTKVKTQAWLERVRKEFGTGRVEEELT